MLLVEFPYAYTSMKYGLKIYFLEHFICRQKASVNVLLAQFILISKIWELKYFPARHGGTHLLILATQEAEAGGPKV